MPAIADWQNRATDNPELIKTLWSDNLYNIGVVPAKSGWFVLDVDGPLGAQVLERLERADKPLPNTLTVQTPRGSGHRHLWFVGHAPSTVAKLGEKLDTRGENAGKFGYVLVPPSVTPQGSYDYIGDTDEIAEAPEWITTKLAGQREAHAAVAGLTNDTEHNIRRAVAYLLASPAAIEGQGGDDQTYRTVAGIRDFGLSPECAVRLLAEHYNPRCVPPWTEEELKAKIEHAWEYAQNEAGAYAEAKPAVEEFAHFRPEQRPVQLPGLSRKRFTLMDEAEMAELKPANWLLKDIMQEKSLCLMYGPYESYKSFLALDLALTLASGVGGWECPVRPRLPVVYAPSEGQVGIALQRKPAWRMAHDIAEVLPFYAFEDVPHVNSSDDMILFAEGIRAKGVSPALIVIDTVANALVGLDEDTKGMGLFVDAMKTLRDIFGCAILAVHHTGQDVRRGPRGGTALPAGFDTILEVEGQQATRTVSVTIRKQKDALKRTKPFYFRGDVVGPSLVFSPIEPKAYKAINSEDETLGAPKIMAALQHLGAISPARAVTTHVLAHQVCPALDGDTHETHERAMKGIGLELVKRAKGVLAAFAITKGRAEPTWALPGLHLATGTDEF